MLKFLHNKAKSASIANKIQFEHPQTLEDVAGLLALKTPVFIYKHSTRCSVSLFAMRRLNMVDVQPGETWVYIDVVMQRNLSLALAEEVGVRHESPQLILLNNGKVAAHASHSRVTEDTVEEWRKAYDLAEQV
jgi:bacillithiol system protein YtxJ